jgi:hypothetical protein
VQREALVTFRVVLYKKRIEREKLEKMKVKKGGVPPFFHGIMLG